MQYIKVIWVHNFQDDPVELYSELDGDRFECRKIEIYRDGSIGIASEEHEIGTTRLGEVAVPELSEIAKDSQFKPIEIDKHLFEEKWNDALRNLNP